MTTMEMMTIPLLCAEMKVEGALVEADILGGVVYLQDLVQEEDMGDEEG